MVLWQIQWHLRARSIINLKKWVYLHLHHRLRNLKSIQKDFLSMKTATRLKESTQNLLRIWVNKRDWVRKFKCRYKHHQKISSKCCEISFQQLQEVIAISNPLNRVHYKGCLKTCSINKCHINSVIDPIKQVKVFSQY